MQIVSNGDNLQETSKPFFWEKNINLSSAELAQRVARVKMRIRWKTNYIHYHSSLSYTALSNDSAAMASTKCIGLSAWTEQDRRDSSVGKTPD